MYRFASRTLRSFLSTDLSMISCLLTSARFSWSASCFVSCRLRKIGWGEIFSFLADSNIFVVGTHWALSIWLFLSCSRHIDPGVWHRQLRHWHTYGSTLFEIRRDRVLGAILLPSPLIQGFLWKLKSFFKTMSFTFFSGQLLFVYKVELYFLLAKKLAEAYLRTTNWGVNTLSFLVKNEIKNKKNLMKCLHWVNKSHHITLMHRKVCCLWQPQIINEQYQ